MTTPIPFTKPQKRAILSAAADLAAALRRENEAAERAAETPPALPDAYTASNTLRAVVEDIVADVAEPSEPEGQRWPKAQWIRDEGDGWSVSSVMDRSDWCLVVMNENGDWTLWPERGSGTYESSVAEGEGNGDGILAAMLAAEAAAKLHGVKLPKRKPLDCWPTEPNQGVHFDVRDPNNPGHSIARVCPPNEYEPSWRWRAWAKGDAFATELGEAKSRRKAQIRAEDAARNLGRVLPGDEIGGLTR